MIEAHLPRGRQSPAPRRIGSLRGVHLLMLAVAYLAMIAPIEAATGPEERGIIATLWRWTPFLAQGFFWNLLISVLSMAIGTVLGFLLGVALVTLRGATRWPFWLFTQVLRNSPWLVILFYCMYLLPFQMKMFGQTVPIPDWTKATLGFALPITAYVAEITRGGILSIPRAQWESSEALAFSPRQTLWMVIVPQCLKRMLPPWMNLYAFVTISTVLVNIVGITDILTAAREALNSDGRSSLLLPMYGYVLFWFFLYCFPISKLTAYLERRWAVIT